MKPKFIVILSCLITVLAGCIPNAFLQEALERMAPDEDEKLVKECLKALSMRDYETVKSQLDPQFVKPGMEADLSKIADMLDHGDPLSLVLVGCNVFSSSGKRRTKLTYQYQYPDLWVLASVTVDTVGGDQRAFGINVKPLPKSLRALNAFTLAEKEVQHYVMLILSMGIPLFILITLIICIRTKLRKRKWFWIVFILIGFGKLGFNWTTGQILFNPLSFSVQLFGVAVFKQGLYAPWIMSISLPLGALIFLMKKKTLAVVQPPPIGKLTTQPTAPANVPGRPPRSKSLSPTE